MITHYFFDTWVDMLSFGLDIVIIVVVIVIVAKVREIDYLVSSD